MTSMEAASLYIARRDRTAHPSGTFDNAGRFYLDEHCDCCRGIRTPSRAYPYSEMVHGRTAKHVAALCGVDERELKRAAREMDRQS